MPLVILEGPDGSGKSTLANRLLKGTKEPTILIKRSGRPAKHETLLDMEAWIRTQSTHRLNVLCDRHPIISDGIYSIAVRGENPPVWRMEDVAPALIDDQYLIVYCRTNLSRMEKNAHVEEQMSGVHANYLGLVQEYDRWMTHFRQVGVRVIPYDHAEDDGAYKVITTVGEFWRSFQ